MDGIARRVIVETSGDITIHSTQDVNDILAFNKALYNASRPSSSLWNKNGWMLVARVPLLLIETWMKMGVNFFDPDDFKYVKRFLNSNEYSGFRTARGNI